MSDSVLLNRAARRQRKLGRTPIVVALPTATRKVRHRKVTAATRRQTSLITIDAGHPEDAKAVVQLMQGYFERTGNQPLTIDPAAPMLIARHKITREVLGICTIKPIPPGKMYVENFHVAPGRQGKAAGRALLERLYEMEIKKVCIVRADNPELLGALSHYGMRVLGFYLEGPFIDSSAEVVERKAQ